MKLALLIEGIVVAGSREIDGAGTNLSRSGLTD